MRRRTAREQSVLSNPILIGALTVLATIAAVTLAYQANNGLPFVPKYHLNLQMRNASELTHGAEVHMGGALVGNVTTINPARDSKGQPIALLKLSLNKTVQPLPVNSTFVVRPSFCKTSIIRASFSSSIADTPPAATLKSPSRPNFNNSLDSLNCHGLYGEEWILSTKISEIPTSTTE